MALPFYIAVEREDGKVRDIVENAFSFFERAGNVRIPRKYLGSGPWKDGDYGSIPWYVGRAYDTERMQVNLKRFWDLLENEPWQKDRHYELVILDTDIYMENTNFVFGQTKSKILINGMVLSDTSGDKPHVTGVVISTNRIKKHYGAAWPDAFYGILLHEKGHFFGLPPESSPNIIYLNDKRVSSLEWLHCDEKNCVMEQINVTGRMDLLEKARHLKTNNPQWFCEPDTDALKKNLKKLYNL